MTVTWIHPCIYEKKKICGGRKKEPHPITNKKWGLRKPLKSLPLSFRIFTVANSNTNKNCVNLWKKNV
jgi:hypothetical protein